MQRSPSWLSALAQAAGRILGVADSGPILPVTSPTGSGSSSGANDRYGFTDICGARLPADKFIILAESGLAAPSVWVDVGRKYPFHANPLTGGSQGAY